MKFGKVSDTSWRRTAQPYNVTQSVIADKATGVIAAINAVTTSSTYVPRMPSNLVPIQVNMVPSIY